LNPNTFYSFSVAASDLSGNQATNNSIIVNATTLPNSTLICSGTSTLAQQGTFSTGYSYEFQTNNTTDVKITYTLLDTDRVGVVAYLWRQSPFAETPMTNVSGNTFTHTITGQTPGSTISYGVKFAYAGGLSVTNYYSYVVGSSCTLGVEDFDKKFDFTFENPASDYVELFSKLTIDKVEVYNMVGNLVLKSTENPTKIDVSAISKGIYLIAVYSGNDKSVKKIIIE